MLQEVIITMDDNKVNFFYTHFIPPPMGHVWDKDNLRVSRKFLKPRIRSGGFVYYLVSPCPMTPIIIKYNIK